MILLQYFTERLPARIFVPLAGVLALAARADVAPSISGFAADAGIALLLVAQFRLWDDLADRSHDAVEHPDRVLVRAPSDTLFRRSCVGLALVNAAAVFLVYDSRVALGTLLMLDLGMACWYLRRGPRSTVGDHVLLLKYPLFVLLIAAGHRIEHPRQVGSSAAVVYLAACLYEAIHDPSSPAAANRTLVACEASLLVVSFALFAIGAHS